MIPISRLARGLFLFVGLTVLFHSRISAQSAPPSDGTAIAYVSSSTNNQEIRLLNPDGTGDRVLWRVPEGTHPLDGIGQSRLSWHPDATELAFDSGHDWERSLSIRDLYSVPSDGSTLRRLTRPPAPADYGAFPMGEVRFTLDALESGDVQVYVEGASEPFRYAARIGETWMFTFPLADFGEGFRQYIRLWDPDQFNEPCHYSEEGWVDVVPNQSTDAGTLFFNITSDRQCSRMVSPSWSHDGSYLIYSSNWILGGGPIPENDIWRISPHAPTGTVGEQVLDPDQNSVTAEGVYGAVMNPSAERGDQWLYWTEHALGAPVYLSNINQPLPPTLLTGCDVDLCYTRGVAWHPNGKVFYWAVDAEYFYG